MFVRLYRARAGAPNAARGVVHDGTIQEACRAFVDKTEFVAVRERRVGQIGRRATLNKDLGTEVAGDRRVFDVRVPRSSMPGFPPASPPLVTTTCLSKTVTPSLTRNSSRSDTPPTGVTLPPLPTCTPGVATPTVPTGPATVCTPAVLVKTNDFAGQIRASRKFNRVRNAVCVGFGDCFFELFGGAHLQGFGARGAGTQHTKTPLRPSASARCGNRKTDLIFIPIFIFTGSFSTRTLAKGSRLG